MHIGIDLGGTKIEAVVLDEEGRFVQRTRVATPAGNYEAILAAIAALVRDAERRAGRAQAVGIGTPGSISRRSGRIKNSNSTCLNSRPLRDDLEACLGHEVFLANDANCFTLSEAVDGAAAGAGSVFGVILGTGVGGGLAVHGRMVDGPNGIAGEWGHNPLPLSDEPGSERPRPCYCGRSSCVETVLCGPALATDHAWLHGGALSAEQIAQAARAGAADCRASLERYTRRLARALAVVINIFDPEVIVLGGGVSNLDALYEDVPRFWGEWVFSDDVRTRLVRNLHGDSSGVRGAAWLARAGATTA